MIKINITIGNQAMQVELPSMKAVHKFNEVSGALPKECGNCKSTNIFISFKNPGGNDYYTLKCGACGADANFGIHKDEKETLYWKDEAMTIYVAPNQQGQQQPQGGQRPATQQPDVAPQQPGQLPKSPPAYDEELGF